MEIAVDRYALGALGTNCYVARAGRGAPEAVVELARNRFLTEFRAVRDRTP